MFCDIFNLDGTPFEGDPRQVLRRNLDKARERGFTLLRRPGDGVLLLRDPSDDGRPQPIDSGGYFDLTTADVAGHAAQADHPDARGDGHPGRVLVPRGLAQPARDRPAPHRRPHDGRQRDDLPAGGAGGGRQRGPLRHVHAQAPGRRAGLGHAHPHEPVRGRRERLPRSRRPVQPLQGGQGLHRRAAPPRHGDHRHHQPDGELLQAAHPRLRGAGLHLVGPQQPLGAHPGARWPRARRPVDPHRVPGPRPGHATPTWPSRSCWPPA